MSELIAFLEENYKGQIKEIKSHLAGDGSLWGRMNAVQSGEEMSPMVRAVIEFCKAHHITAEQVNGETLLKYFKEAKNAQ